MKSERLLNFSVENPQLELDAGGFKSGRKRFSIYKNEVSLGILAAVPSLESEQKIKASLKGLDTKDNERSFVKRGKYHEASTLSPPNYNGLEFLKQPQYTKRQPKYMNNNPIVGISYHKHFSPTSNMRMANYALQVFNQSKKV
ncbi:hypothetical protein SteCoe_37449 [Stentor coeruleus]|uniref:Uncharacterized protein n=1 Tax=Stentor coeruleus TaxID=5963 RepID=A0A1R2AN26_9CILI|nr:hypothetical protein SteCoe_37449 [Stentor coeruleus]